tara:strand:+ start:168 stop:344 length:177 start_codon:yes stop_codon:yes gene_type:complete
MTSLQQALIGERTKLFLASSVSVSALQLIVIAITMIAKFGTATRFDLGLKAYASSRLR